ncbi:DUF2637 domain-containing protein [Streptomyces aquilus]|uniref:DUF2637 domain-containing protein n=1 Tax=Streptomyces aquilus TaxID=2548456 RepID=A0A3Q9C661_9ACTN|nr:DUF2637 domain-containing protein [Streptomyces aquilus]AZP22829.1 DUF2637 domain-containing protein [Streptomyces aquilus]
MPPTPPTSRITATGADRTHTAASTGTHHHSRTPDTPIPQPAGADQERREHTTTPSSTHQRHDNTPTPTPDTRHRPDGHLRVSTAPVDTPHNAPPPPPPTSTHRLLTGVIATGAVLIAGIGFTGSYTAVRDLAERKGFGNFAALYPVGIDAGICVLLALDLHLTHLRIPLPLLRHTAWLLTTATITFNAATAWPDPLGVSMHAVIPLLFIVTLEAARHATGRLAHLTTGTHMDPIRPARWLLAPARTLLLWRRMKLWEIRSYQRAITLEQQQLIYRTQLKSRYGRTWRHTAPVQALLPLRLARYGTPIPLTTPDSYPRPTTPPTPVPAAPPHGHPHPINSKSTRTPLPRTEPASEPPPGRPAQPADTSTSNTPTHHPGPTPQQLDAFYQALHHPTGTTPAPAPWASWRPDNNSHTPAPHHQQPTDSRPQQTAEATHNNPTPHAGPLDTSPTAHAAQPHPCQQTHHPNGGPTQHHLASVPLDADPPATAAPGNDSRPEATGHPLTGRTPTSLTATDSSRPPLPPRSQSTSPAPQPARRTDESHHGTRPPTPPPPTPADEPPPAPQQQPDPHPDDRGRNPPSIHSLTLTDRYYLEWMNYQALHGTEPTPEQLSTHLAHQGLLGRGGKPLSPSNIRRHLLNWRLYNLWTTHHTDNTPPTPDHLAQQCAIHGITGQYNRPITPQHIAHHTPEYQRRHHALTHHQTPTPATQPANTSATDSTAPEQ